MCLSCSPSYGRQFCLPTVAGLAAALDIDVPEKLEDTPRALLNIVAGLLGNSPRSRSECTIHCMGYGGESSWSYLGLAALDRRREQHRRHSLDGSSCMEPAQGGETRRRRRPREMSPSPAWKFWNGWISLQHGSEAENRSEQSTYATDAGHFCPKPARSPQAIIAEAGTGVGKAWVI